HQNRRDDGDGTEDVKKDELKHLISYKPRAEYRLPAAGGPASCLCVRTGSVQIPGSVRGRASGRHLRRVRKTCSVKRQRYKLSALSCRRDRPPIPLRCSARDTPVRT